jgi:hypothetical protein
VLDRGSTRLTRPQPHRTPFSGSEPDSRNSFANQIGHAPALPLRYAMQSLELLLGQIDLSLFHRCQYVTTSDTCQVDTPIISPRRSALGVESVDEPAAAMAGNPKDLFERKIIDRRDRVA